MSTRWEDTRPGWYEIVIRLNEDNPRNHRIEIKNLSVRKEDTKTLKKLEEKHEEKHG